MADHEVRRLMNEGGGLAHAVPSLGQNRWTRHWEPLCVLASKRHDDPAEEFARLREAYARRRSRLRVVGISFKAIALADLDSPLQSGTEFDRALCLAIERRSRFDKRKEKGNRK